MAEKDWYYALNDQQLGPVAISELRQLIRAGRIGRDDLIWHAGMDDWLPVAEVGEVARQPEPTRRSAPTAPPVQAESTRTQVRSPSRTANRNAESAPVRIPVAPQENRSNEKNADSPSVQQPSVDIHAAVHPVAEDIAQPPASQPPTTEPPTNLQTTGVPTSRRTSSAQSSAAQTPTARIVVWLCAAAVLMLATVFLVIAWLRVDATESFAGTAWFIIAIDLGAFLLAFAIDRVLDLSSERNNAA